MAKRCAVIRSAAVNVGYLTRRCLDLSAYLRLLRSSYINFQCYTLLSEELWLRSLRLGSLDLDRSRLPRL